MNIDGYLVHYPHCGLNRLPIARVTLHCPECNRIIKEAERSDLLAFNIKKQIDPDHFYALLTKEQLLIRISELETELKVYREGRATH